MGHIWGRGLQHMELFQHMGKKILQKAQHMGNIWVSFSNIWGSFETYRSFLKHMGPFWNIWGLSETYGAFRERSLFLFPTCHIALFRYTSFFSQKFCLSQIRPVPDISAKEKRLLEVSGRAWNLFSTIKGGKPPAINFKLILRLRFCLPVRCTLRRRRPDRGLDLVWFFELRRGRLKSARMRKFKMSAARKDWTRRTTSKLELQLFLSSSVFVACMLHRDDDRSTVTLTTRETRWCLFGRLKFFKGIWVSRLWSCLGLRRSAALVTDSPTCDVFFTRWVLCFCFEEIENWWVLCCSIAG